eukprot:gb/GFBE01045896.1/.p1 GENE.gb/GFBE01045896.1/~~gb/GFBE01045896.1/.p1  ORF type:complete len:116 (+),score=10.16 gb/GFBE01045896.1/:1-348(+)
MGRMAGKSRWCFMHGGRCQRQVDGEPNHASLPLPFRQRGSGTLALRASGVGSSAKDIDATPLLSSARLSILQLRFGKEVALWISSGPAVVDSLARTCAVADDRGACNLEERGAIE